MKNKLLGIALFGLTLASIVYYPQLMAKSNPIQYDTQRSILVRKRRSTSSLFWIRPAA